MNNLILYGLRFNDDYFQRGPAFVLGKFNRQPFSCISKSGSQNLWLPFTPTTGLRVFHPRSTQLGGRRLDEAAKTYYDAQSCLAKLNLAPKPFEVLEIYLTFEHSRPPMEPWNCFGIVMERVLNGGIFQILRNLQRLGITEIPDYCELIETYHDPDALTLRDYAVLCKFFGAEDKTTEKTEAFRRKLPQEFNIGLDLLSPSNLVLDQKGETKAVDFDYTSI